jgi:cyclohexanecarboxylate-CoA ligase
VLGLTDQDTILMPATFGHQTGFLFGCCLPVMLGATVVLQDVWNPDTMLQLADLHGATWSSMPPPMVLDACAAAEGAGRTASTLRAVRTSGGPVPWSLAERTRRQLGAQLLTSWGLTETGVCTMRRAGEPEGPEPTDGVPLPGVEIELVNSGGGAARELVVRGPGLFAGYLDRGAVQPAPPWFHTGDLAEHDGRGGIRITGRIKDLIIRGGENLPVAEIEGLIGEHADVAAVAVVAVPDERLGERACAVVVPSPGAEPTLDGLCRTLSEAGLTRQFWPEYMVLAAQLPHTATGKVARASLRTTAARQLTQAPPSASTVESGWDA